MATYTPTDHSELSAAAAQLDATQLAAKADRAEALLGIAGTNYTGTAAETLKLAVALQINRTLRLEARGQSVGDPDVTAESKGDQSVTYGRDKSGAVDPLDREAVLLVKQVVASGADLPLGPPLPRSHTTQNVVVW